MSRVHFSYMCVCGVSSAHLQKRLAHFKKKQRHFFPSFLCQAQNFIIIKNGWRITACMLTRGAISSWREALVTTQREGGKRRNKQTNWTIDLLAHSQHVRTSAINTPKAFMLWVCSVHELWKEVMISEGIPGIPSMYPCTWGWLVIYS